MTTRQRHLQIIIDKMTEQQQYANEQLEVKARAGLMEVSGVLAEEIVRLERIIQRAKAEING